MSVLKCWETPTSLWQVHCPPGVVGWNRLVREAGIPGGAPGLEEAAGGATPGGVGAGVDAMPEGEGVRVGAMPGGKGVVFGASRAPTAPGTGLAPSAVVPADPGAVLTIAAGLFSVLT